MVKLHAAEIVAFDPFPAMQLWKIHALDAPRKRRRPEYIVMAGNRTPRGLLLIILLLLLLLCIIALLTLTVTMTMTVLTMT